MQQHMQQQAKERSLDVTERKEVVPPVVKAGVQAAMSIDAWRRKRKALQLPRWGVREAAGASRRMLDDVAAYCLGQRWGPAAEESLVEAVPALAEPLRTLVVTSEEMQSHAGFATHSAAQELTSRALNAAQEIAKLVDLHYRAVPSVTRMPSLTLRFTASQRTRALGEASKRYDQLVERWYGFVFSSALPSSRQGQLEDIGDELGVGEEIALCESQHLRCQELAQSGSVAWEASRQVVTELGRAISALEAAAYRAVTAVMP